MTRRWFWVCVGAAAAGGLLAGGLFGWFVRGGWTSQWVAASGAWVGAIGTILAVATALGIAIRDGRIDREDRYDRDARQARNVLTTPGVEKVFGRPENAFAFTVTNYSELPIRNILLEEIRVAWHRETKEAGRPVYRSVPWTMTDNGDPRNIKAWPLLVAGESHTFVVDLDTGKPFRESYRSIGTYQVSLSLTDINGHRWRNVNGQVTLQQRAEPLGKGAEDPGSSAG
ncbi:hypothetical protein IHQ52_18980 [Gordonia amicalis]|uniref:hypothetical protein n=1 Tax=Gordonia amicalis TaxID=89053 RepID=UPI001EDEFC43|nr:hypothetical protein [Gordonia amicalis]UKO91064.1 hypothetical protein IHQ52_18980 [Gordonia amicalis]